MRHYDGGDRAGKNGTRIEGNGVARHAAGKNGNGVARHGARRNGAARNGAARNGAGRNGNGAGKNGNGACMCRLRRADGSRWRVLELEFPPGGARVRAVRLEGRSAPFGSDGGERLEDEVLRSGDCLEWVAADGTITWAMRTPVSGLAH